LVNYDGLGKRLNSTTVPQTVNRTKATNKAQGAGTLSFLIGLKFAKNVRWKIITINSIVATPNQENAH
jgi:hypothetical protein